MAYTKLEKQFELFKAKKGKNALTKEALGWFYYNAKVLSGKASFERTTFTGVMTSDPIPGKLYLYRYDPKYKDVLPRYDVMPLVLITSVTPQGWYGINFHYIPEQIRLKVLGAMFDTLDNRRISDKKKLMINWQTAQQLAGAVGATPVLKESIKQYLSGHLTTPLLEIHPQYWSMVCFLPLARFKKNGRI